MTGLTMLILSSMASLALSELRFRPGAGKLIKLEHTQGVRGPRSVKLLSNVKQDEVYCAPTVWLRSWETAKTKRLLRVNEEFRHARQMDTLTHTNRHSDFPIIDMIIHKTKLPELLDHYTNDMWSGTQRCQWATGPSLCWRVTWARSGSWGPDSGWRWGEMAAAGPRCLVTPYRGGHTDCYTG